VLGVPPAERSDIPGTWESVFTTISIMGGAIVAAKLTQSPPDVLLRPNVGIFRTLDFYQATAILRVGDAIKADVKNRLVALIEGRV